MGRIDPELLARYLDTEATEPLPLPDDPTTADELKGLLDVAAALTPPPAVEPDPSFVQRGRAELLAAIRSEPSPRPSHVRRLWRSIWPTGPAASPLEPHWLSRPALAAALLLALTVSAGGGIASAAQRALPGDALYPVKTTLESVQVSLATSDEARAQAYIDLAARRLAEIEAASANERPGAAAVAAEGFSHSIAQAEVHLDLATAHGKDVGAMSTRLSEHLAHHQQVLQRLQDRAPAPAKPALEKAANAAAKGLSKAGASVATAKANASAKSNALAKPERTPKPPTVPTPAPPKRSQPTAVARSAPPTATATTQPSPVAVEALERSIADVEAIATAEAAVPGKSLNGLLAKLEAAHAALARGQQRAALQILDAFHEELAALHRTGNLDNARYEELSDQYRALVQELGGTPKRDDEPRSSERGHPDGTSPKRDGGPPFGQPQR